jgi:hypothetical protein
LSKVVLNVSISLVNSSSITTSLFIWIDCWFIVFKWTDEVLQEK